jgi:hypothetical protein
VTPTRSQKARNKFHPAPGKDLEIYPADPEVIKAITNLEETRTRSLLGILVTSFLLASVAASGFYGLLSGEIELVAATWTGIFATLTLVLRFYFERKPKPK